MNSLEHSLHLGRGERRERGGREEGERRERGGRERRNERKGERCSRNRKKRDWDGRAKNSFNVDLCRITSLSKYFIG